MEKINRNNNFTIVEKSDGKLYFRNSIAGGNNTKIFENKQKRGK
jgi:hypothetical protein